MSRPRPARRVRGFGRPGTFTVASGSVLACVLVGALSSPGSAAEPPAIGGQDALSSVDVRLRALEQLVLQQQNEIETMKRLLQPGTGLQYFEDSPARRRRSGIFTVQGPVPPEPLPPGELDPDTPRPPGAPGAEGERPASERPPELLLLEQGGVLLAPGTLQIEPSFEYSHISNSRIAISGFTIFSSIVIGTIQVDEVNRDIVTNSLSVRYGVFDRLQVEARVPGVYRHDEEILAAGTANQRTLSVDGLGLGDVEASASWQALIGSGYLPDTILRLRARMPTGTSPFEISRVPLGAGETRLESAPTGTGFFGAGLASTFVWRLDPAVMFTGIGYTANLPRSFSGFGSIDPGDTIEWFAGMNIGLSEQVALNVSVVDNFTLSTTQNGQASPGTSSNDARLVVGTSIGLTPRTSLLFSAAAGLTGDSPDFTFTVSVPITFRLF